MLGNVSYAEAEAADMRQRMHAPRTPDNPSLTPERRRQPRWLSVAASQRNTFPSKHFQTKFEKIKV